MSKKTSARPAAATKSGPVGALDRFFRISERGSTISREVRGGLVTFFAMCYILVLNPLLMGGPDSMGGFLGGGVEANQHAIAAGTALVAGLMSILMGVVANFPIALATGLGINAMVAFGIATIPSMTWADAMGLVVLEGIIILLLVLTGFREAVFKAVPSQLKVAISVGIGLFIAFIGLVNAGIVRPAKPVVEFGIGGSLRGWPAVVFVFGLFLMIVLVVLKVRGGILISIVAATVLAVVLESIFHLGPQEPDGKNPSGWALQTPALDGSPVQLPDLSTLGQFSLLGSVNKIGVVAVVLLVFSLMLADFFDTMGTMVAIGAEANLLDKDGNPPGTRKILVVDSVAAIAGGAGGVSSNTSYIESAAGVGEGARTGLASVVTGLLFLASMFIAPLVAMVPYEAATPALVIVGFLMMTQVAEIDWKNIDIALPAFLTIILMPFSYSITVGIGVGFLSYVAIRVARGKAGQVHPLLWVVSAMFLAYFTMGPLRGLFHV
ncbi:NCS2 family permease [Buchananella hordeovulneris]|uniref:Permease n=1 Tax=Buchananella hordeovulneris TaxID=52770 RepID=A0A1Q5PVK5_9ACTO|nr:NCS2 family permease [Buchananella hordeovulneris]OKL51450.1 permease [Buchananella hordeovulneris]RRD44286.1 NCS2 family permease [Buchananella hordeovulneris]